jgi:hypothetical protein
MPLVQNTYVDRILTQVSVAYKNDANSFVAEKVFPTVMVEKRTGKYFTYDKANLRSVNSKRTGKAYAKEIEFGLSKTDYGPLHEHSLRKFIENDEFDQADDPYNPRIDTTSVLTEGLLIEKEVGLATTLLDTATVTNNTTKSGTSQWNDYSNSDPFSDITTAIKTVKEASLLTPNTLVLSWPVWLRLRNHPDLIERVKYSSLGMLTTSLLQELFPEVQNVVIAGAMYNSANEGATDSLGYVWGTSAWLMNIAPVPALRTVSAGYHLQLKAARQVENWRREDNKGEYVQVTDYYAPQLVAAAGIYLIKNAVA